MNNPIPSGVDSKRLEALLSEYKGNLFEYLLSLTLARKFKIEYDFLDTITDDIAMMLEQQESLLRNYYPYLLVELPKLAELTCEKICSEFDLNDDTVIDEILMVGKVLGAANDNRFEEADLLVKTNGRLLPLSVKISKLNAYVNTKSGGIRTFFNKYFSQFGTEIISPLQVEFNHFCDIEYAQMAMTMHEEVGLPYTEGFKNWEAQGFEVLPGRLSVNEKKILHTYYGVVNDRISSNLCKLEKLDKVLFTKCLWSLMGYSSPEIVQVMAFYQLKDEVFVKSSVGIHTLEQGVELRRHTKRANNLDLEFDDFSLQIRLKPMNKFTSLAFKVNCAIKYF